MFNLEQAAIRAGIGEGSMPRDLPPMSTESEGNAATLIGSRLKSARLRLGLTLEEVARATGLTKGFISKLERDQTGGSVASLVRLCDALEIPVASLFTAYEGELVRANERPPINFGGERLSEALLTPTREHRLQAIFSEIQPGGGSGIEAYSLPAEIEFVFIISGAVAVTTPRIEIVMRTGDALTFSAHTPHTFRNPSSSEPAQVLWIISPALPSGQTVPDPRHT